jgi:hypothetical protein
MTDKVTGTENKKDSQIMRNLYKSGEMEITHYHLHLVTKFKMCGALSPCSLNGFMMKYMGKDNLLSSITCVCSTISNVPCRN